MLGNPWNLPDWSQWIRPIPVGDGWRCTCGQKKGWAAHGFRGKLQYDSGGMTVKQTSTRWSANPRIATGLQTRSAATLKTISLTQNRVGIQVTWRKRSSNPDEGVRLKGYWHSLYVKVDRWFAVFKLFLIKPRCMACVCASKLKQTLVRWEIWRAHLLFNSLCLFASVWP